MNHLPFTLAAYFLNSISVLIDKYLLTKSAPNPLFYIYYISLFSLIALVLIPFSNFPPLTVLAYASVSTLLWTAGAYFMFLALQKGNPARVVPAIGTVIPVVLSVIAYMNGSITPNQTWSAFILIFGLIFLTLPYFMGKIHLYEVVYILISSLLFADSYVVLRWAYEQHDFLSVFSYSRVVLIPILAAIPLIPPLRKQILSSHGSHNTFNFFSRSGLLFVIGQATGGASQLLLTFSISLANPALVNSLQGSQYIFLFIFSLTLAVRLPVFREKLSRTALISKIIGIIIIAFGLFLMSVSESPQNNSQNKLGYTFSPRFAKELGLNPETTFKKSLEDINAKHIRLPIYWDEFEPIEGVFHDNYLTPYLDLAHMHNADVIVVVGFKQPRWPECYPPPWTLGLSKPELQQKLLALIKKEITLYSHHPAIVAWQVENEPFLEFGYCPGAFPIDYEFVKREIELVKSLDNRPILITDSGEISNWTQAVSLTGYFGTTLYRQVWNPYIGYFTYPIPPMFYSAKDYLVKKVTGHDGTKTIISELQTEPWIPGQKSLWDWDINEQKQAFPASKISQHVTYAKSTGFETIYLWGVEWWYYMDQHGHPEYIEEVKSIFQNHRE